MIKNWIEKIKNKLSALKRKKPETQKPEQGLSLNDLSETEKDLAPLQKKKSIDWKHLTQKIKSQWLYLKTLKADDIVNHFKKIFKQAKQIKLNKETGQKVFEVGNKFKKQAASIDWQKIPDKIFSPESRGIINRAFVVSTIVCVSYGTGKTLALLSKGKDQSLERKAVARPPIATKDLTTAELKMISDTNIFRTETKAKEDGSGRKRIDRNTKCLAATQKTSLPITLVNTVVLQDTVKSIAAVQLRTGKDPVNVREGEVIAKLAKVDKITRLELILKNLKTGKRLFL